MRRILHGNNFLITSFCHCIWNRHLYQVKKLLFCVLWSTLLMCWTMTQLQKAAKTRSLRKYARNQLLPHLLGEPWTAFIFVLVRILKWNGCESHIWHGKDSKVVGRRSFCVFCPDVITPTSKSMCSCSFKVPSCTEGFSFLVLDTQSI